MNKKSKNPEKTGPMTAEEEKLDRRLNRVIEDAITYCDAHDVLLIIENIFARVSETNSVLVSQGRIPWSNGYIRIRIHHRLRLTEKPEDDDGLADDPTAQPELDLPEIEQFRGLPKRLPVSFEFWQSWYATRHPGEPLPEVPVRRGMVWLNYRKESDLSVRAEMLRVKDTGIRADTVSRQRLATGNSWYDQLASIYGDLPPEELDELWLRDHPRRAGNGR